MITLEGRRLAERWSRYGRSSLDSYLIQDVEHPGINPQSVLVRAFIVDRLFPGEFVDMIEEELAFSACACHALRENREGQFPGFHREITGGSGRLPEFLRKIGESPGRFSLPGLADELAKCLTVGFDGFHSPFAKLWREGLAGRVAGKPEILELACGSANDYRHWDACGVAALADYTGMDVCGGNIENAKRRFPDVKFVEGDACRVAGNDAGFDVVLAFDLLEHLSADGLDAALGEMVRLSRDEVWLSCFNAVDSPAHEFREVEDYHWNTLSVRALAARLESEGLVTEVVSIAGELEARFAGYTHYNREAQIVIGRRR